MGWDITNSNLNNSNLSKIKTRTRFLDSGNTIARVDSKECNDWTFNLPPDKCYVYAGVGKGAANFSNSTFISKIYAFIVYKTSENFLKAIFIYALIYIICVAFSIPIAIYNCTNPQVGYISCTTSVSTIPAMETTNKSVYHRSFEESPT